MHRVLKKRKRRWFEISLEAALFLCETPNNLIRIDEFIDSRYRDGWWMRKTRPKYSLPTVIKKTLLLLLDDVPIQECQKHQGLEYEVIIPLIRSTIFIELSRWIGIASPAAKQKKQINPALEECFRTKG